MDQDKNCTISRLKLALSSIIANAEEQASDTMPGEPYKGAIWWIHCQESRRERETRQAYKTRLTSTLRLFLAATPQHRRLIVEARKKGVFWFGEPHEDFLIIARITLKTRRLPAYWIKLKQRGALLKHQLLEPFY